MCGTGIVIVMGGVALFFYVVGYAFGVTDGYRDGVKDVRNEGSRK